MRQITTLTDNALQKISILNDDSLIIEMELRFLTTQQMWSYNVIEDDFTVNGRNLVLSPNMLRQFDNIITFGIACTSTDGFEPYKIDDFTTGRVKIYVLSESEKESVESLYFTNP